MYLALIRHEPKFWCMILPVYVLTCISINKCRPFPTLDKTQNRWLGWLGMDRPAMMATTKSKLSVWYASELSLMS